MTKTEIIQDALNLTVDDKWGDKTDAAVALERAASRARHSLDKPTASAETADATTPGVTTMPVVSAGAFSWKLDERSERNIATLLPPVQTVARAFLERLAKNHIAAQVVSGSRSYAEQNALYEQGRSKSGAIVTKARGGYSNHNFGIAFDIGIFTQAGKYLDDSPLYASAGKIGKELGLHWGGDWKSIQDEPHFELHPQWAADLSEDEMLSELRARTAQGKEIFG